MFPARGFGVNSGEKASGGVRRSHLLLWVAHSPRLERIVTHSKVFGKLAHRFIAQDELADALAAAADRNSRGITEGDIGVYAVNHPHSEQRADLTVRSD